MNLEVCDVEVHGLDNWSSYGHDLRIMNDIVLPWMKKKNNQWILITLVLLDERSVLDDETTTSFRSYYVYECRTKGKESSWVTLFTIRCTRRTHWIPHSGLTINSGAPCMVTLMLTMKTQHTNLARWLPCKP